MKSLLTLQLDLLENLGDICSVNTARDQKTVTMRWENENDGLLTIVLPKLAKALERGLETGLWPTQEVAPTWRHHQGLPAFLRGFLSRVFDSSTGVLLNDPDTYCIWAVRQFCLFSQKIRRDCSPDRVAAALDSYVSTDHDLMYLPARISPDRLAAFQAVARRIFGRIFQECDRKIASFELRPRHGPGAVAERLSQAQKRDFEYWTVRLESCFPYWRYTRNSGYASAPRLIPMDQELPVRVVTVPKTQSTPRIIAIEPSSVQYAQQGLKNEIYELIARGPHNRILGFQDQSRNRALALKASIDGSLSTLDLSEASDRVHWFLVLKMTEGFPHLQDYLLATRSTRADVPSRGVIPLQKFASMGSALTFPVEAIVFTILSICGMEQAHHVRYRVQDLPGLLSVYGDDIIVPTDATGYVIDWLEHFGAKVNQRKSFRTGKFRESCGAEYYDGIDVSVVRIRTELPSSRNDAASLAASIDLYNRLIEAGLWTVAGRLRRDLSTLRDFPLVPAVSRSENSYLGYTSFTRFPQKLVRYNSDLQRFERSVPVLRSHGLSYSVDGEPGLLEWFHQSFSAKDFVDPYDSQERASSFSIKRRWVPEVINHWDVDG